MKRFYNGGIIILFRVDYTDDCFSINQYWCSDEDWLGGIHEF